MPALGSCWGPGLLAVQRPPEWQQQWLLLLQFEALSVFYCWSGPSWGERRDLKMQKHQLPVSVVRIPSFMDYRQRALLTEVAHTSSKPSTLNPKPPLLQQLWQLGLPVRKPRGRAPPAGSEEWYQ